MRTIIVGFSGGADSMAMLHMLYQQQLAEQESMRLVVTHCNFHLRGEESMRDQHFCEKICHEWGLQLIVKDFDTYAYMQEHHLSLEMAARQLRYQWWENLATQLEETPEDSVQIAVAHHQDDSIETLLMNLMRGTGIKGLTGIPVTRDRIIRPLLHLSRTNILQYIEEHHLQYVTDSTNLENDITRNKIRNLLLPLMEQINPNARKGMALSMQHLQQSQWLEGRALQELFSTAITRCEAGVQWHEWTLPDDICDETQIETLFHHWTELHPNARRNHRLFYTEPDWSTFQEQLDLSNLSNLSTPSPFPSESFDSDLLVLPLTCRHWRQGDRIQPLGMTGEKLVSDLFSNAHYSPIRKRTTWIVTDATGRLLWVIGLRRADWCKVTDHTRNVLSITIPQ